MGDDMELALIGLRTKIRLISLAREAGCLLPGRCCGERNRGPEGGVGRQGVPRGIFLLCFWI